ncbi:prepilin-type N-terminal cleavage/methylation domain-containing protein [Candidatus Dojkabacteria bacterium]|nr:prepilin-type N-terminal cleavage/methylation domain-containing protein [Candidatus Dojkabacteria bacterium]
MLRQAQHDKNREKGFTLLELLLVIAIISVLAGIIMFSLKPADRLREANQTKYLSNANDIERAFNSYVVDNGGNLPTAFNTLTYGYYDICRQGQSGSCVSLDELVTNGKMSSIPVDSDKLTATTTGFKLKYDPTRKEALIYSNAEYTSRINSGTTLTEGLVGYWKMDETASPAIDSSGSGINGIWTNSPTLTVGKFGNGLSFNGTNNFVNLSGASNFAYKDGDKWGVSMWFKTTANYLGTNAGVKLFSKATGGGTYGYAIAIGQLNSQGYDNKIGFVIDQPPGYNYVLSTNTLPVANDGNWHHVYISFDAYTNTNIGANIYFDGVSYGYLSSTVPRSNWASTTSVTNKIGSGNGYEYFTGTIDEVRVLNRALHLDEVQALHTWAPAPVAYWKFDEGQGNTAYNSSLGLEVTGATGGTITDVGGYRIHTFTSSGTFTPINSGILDLLVVAGGGGGGGYIGGGGGGGGVIYNSNFAIASNPISVTVGSGGSAGSGSSANSTKGGNSIFGNQVAIGGGAGGGGETDNTSHDGGSGGGQGRAVGGRGGLVGIATVGQGSNGGTGTNTDGANNASGGGGGGAGGVGGNGSGGLAGAGGSGLAYSISGSSMFYAGGGGGGGYSGTGGVGGTGGGGTGASGTGTFASAGTANTGGGGGAAGYPTNTTGGAGGSGIVIARYPIPKNGTLTNAPVWVTGKFGNALQFSRTSNTYVSLKGTNAFCTPNITVSGWFKRTETGFEHSIAGVWWNNWGRIYVNTSNLLGWSWLESDGSTWHALSSSSPINTNVWYFFTITYDKSAQTGKLYLNGNLEDTEINALNIERGTCSNYTVIGQNGEYSTYSGNMFNGLIDDFRIYNYALTQSQVTQIFQENL